MSKNFVSRVMSDILLQTLYASMIPLSCRANREVALTVGNPFGLARQAGATNRRPDMPDRTNATHNGLRQ